MSEDIGLLRNRNLSEEEEVEVTRQIGEPDLSLLSDKDKAQYEITQHITRTHMTMATFLLYLLSLCFVGSMYFKQGFLLSRNVLNNQTILDHSFEPQYKKVVIVLIDALRYDFTINATDSNGDLIKDSNYLNHLPFISETINNSPDQSMLFNFIADAPTTTLQRLKALTTGTLPTFVDAGKNFAGTEILEDNWLDQLIISKSMLDVNRNRTIGFIGDDTWLDLFPNQFKRSDPFPSFDVWDLHTVDNGIIDKFDNYLKSDLDVIITHFLGVDHCGHRYGPNHLEMGNKLSQINDFLIHVNNNIDNDTLVLVFGDHGMDTKGDHGGDSYLETDSALFAFSKKNIRNEKEQLKSMKDLGLLTNDKIESLILNFESTKWPYRSVQQIDLVPTLSLLLGLPIPFNNLGMIIPEFFLNDNQSEKELIHALHINLIQVYNYLKEYQSQFPKSEIALELYPIIQPIFKDYFLRYSKLNKLNEIELIDLVHLQINLLRKHSLNSLQKVWARFDLVQISMGLILLLSSCLIMFNHLINRSTPPTNQSNLQSSFSTIHGPMLFQIFISLVLGAIIGMLGTIQPILDYFEHSMNLVDQSLFLSFFCSTLGYWFNCFIQPQNFIQVSLINSLNKPLNFIILFNSIVIIILIFISASVNMVIQEDRIITTLLILFSMMSLGFNHFNLSNSSDPTVLNLSKSIRNYSLLFLSLVCISGSIGVCREEQMPSCQSTFYGILSSITISKSYIIAFYLLITSLLPIYLKYIFNSTKNYQTILPIWIEYGLRGSLVLIVIYWSMDSINYSISNTELFITIKNLSIRTSLLLSIIMGSVCFFTNPLLLEVQMVETNVNESSHQLRTEHSMVVLGLGNGYGAPMLMFVTVLLLPLMISQQPMGGIMLVLLLIQIILLSELMDKFKDIFIYLNSNSLIFEPIPKRIEYLMSTLLYLLAQQAFFSTGHQNTLSTIQWKTGFIGLTTVSTYISPILVLMNSISSHVLIGPAILLIYHWKTLPTRHHLFYTLPTTLFRTILYLFFLCFINGTFASLFASYHRRHLMVWKLFAPRYIFSLIPLFITPSSALFIGLFFPSVIILQEVMEIVGLIKRD